MLYLLFLFLVVIILLNVLIAQVSETYTAVQSTTRDSLLFHCSRLDVKRAQHCGSSSGPSGGRKLVPVVAWVVMWNHTIMQIKITQRLVHSQCAIHIHSI